MQQRAYQYLQEKWCKVRKLVLVLWCWEDLKGHCLIKEMGIGEREEEVGYSNKKTQTDSWILVQKLKSWQEDIKGGWVKASGNCAAGRRTWSDRRPVIIRMTGLKTRNIWGRKGEVLWKLKETPETERGD